MPRSWKVSALLTFGLAILLFPFFEICKHAPALSLGNAFGSEDENAVSAARVGLATNVKLSGDL